MGYNMKRGSRCVFISSREACIRKECMYKSARSVRRCYFLQTAHRHYRRVNTVTVARLREGTYLRIIGVLVSASTSGCTSHAAVVGEPATLSVLGDSWVCGECDDLVCSVLGSNHDQRTGICARHAGEDTRVDDEDVVRAVDFGVEVDDGRPA